MEKHQLEYVLAVAKYKQFSRAAEEISLSQSALSQQIKKLEEELGVQIFERTTRYVHLTRAGEEFLVFAKRILAEMERARQAMDEYNALERGKIVIGAIPIIGYLGLTSLIASFHKNYPKINLEIIEAGSEELFKRLHSGDIDVALLTPYLESKNSKTVEIYPLIHDEIVLITPKSHPFAARQVISLSDAAQEKFLFMKSGFGMRGICRQACLEEGFEPNIVFESSQIETICSLVEEGLGIAFLTSRVASRFQNSRFSIVHLKKSLKRTTALAIPKHPVIPKAVIAFRDFSIKFVNSRFMQNMDDD